MFNGNFYQSIDQWGKLFQPPEKQYKKEDQKFNDWEKMLESDAEKIGNWMEELGKWFESS